MTFKGSVASLEDLGEDVKVSLTNVKRARAAQWADYSMPVAFRVPHSMARAFPIGRRVRIEITAR